MRNDDYKRETLITLADKDRKGKQAESRASLPAVGGSHPRDSRMREHLEMHRGSCEVRTTEPVTSQMAHCHFGGFLAAIFGSYFAPRRGLEWPDDHALTGRFDHFLGDRPQFINLQNALNLGKEALDQPEVPARDAHNRRHRLRIGEIIRC